MNSLTKLVSVSLTMAVALALAFTTAWGQPSNAMEIQMAKAALDKNPSSEAARVKLIGLYNEAGIEQLQAKKTDGAIGHFMDAMDVVDQSKGAVDKTNTVVQSVMYNLAYTHGKMGDAEQSVRDLEELIKLNPSHFDARYLMGVTLAGDPGKGNFERGMEVLRVMAMEGKGTDHDRAAHAAIRFAYNRSTIEDAMGSSKGALEMLSPMRAQYGADGAATKKENADVSFALGIYSLNAGNATDATANLEDVGSRIPAYALKDGVKLTDILAGVYYQAGIEFLSRRTEQGGRNALDMFESAEFMEGKDATDIHHGKALAYYRMNQMDNVSKELQIIAAKNPVEFKKIVAQ